MAEDDWDGWVALTERLGDRVQLVGDDLFVTNSSASSRASSWARATPSWSRSTRSAPCRRRSPRWTSPAAPATRSMVSHRSGETEDTFIADLAVATSAGQIKTGAPSRSERVAKYNQLIRIEEQLGPASSYPGRSAFRA